MKTNTSFSIRWLTIASFEFRLGDQTVLSDPCVTDSPGTDLTASCFQAADLVFLTHIHWDHVLDLPDLVRRFDPKICVGAPSAMPLAQWLNPRANRLIPMTPDLTLDFGAFSLRALYGRHTDIGQPFLDATRKTEQDHRVRHNPALQAMQGWGLIDFTNYLITSQSGLKILFWGGNVSTEQVHLLKGLQPDVAILQYSRQSAQELVDLARAIGCSTIIPHHMDLYQEPAVYRPRIEHLQACLNEQVPGCTVLQAQQGHWYDYDPQRRTFQPSVS